MNYEFMFQLSLLVEPFQFHALLHVSKLASRPIMMLVVDSVMGPQSRMYAMFVRKLILLTWL